MFSRILVTIGQIVEKWQQFSKSKMAALVFSGREIEKRIFPLENKRPI